MQRQPAGGAVPPQVCQRRPNPLDRDGKRPQPRVKCRDQITQRQRPTGDPHGVEHDRINSLDKRQALGEKRINFGTADDRIVRRQ